MYTSGNVMMSVCVSCVSMQVIFLALCVGIYSYLYLSMYCVSCIHLCLPFQIYISVCMC